jgi:peptide/nickel transport system ATP-binding protein
MTSDILLNVQDLVVTFATENGTVRAVDGVSFHLKANEVLGLVGESGCGKSVTAESIMGLLDPSISRSDGQVLFDGQNLLALSPAEKVKIRGNQLGMVFQDPLSALNPVLRIGDQLVESMHAHLGLGRHRARQRAIELLEQTGIPDPQRRIDSFPHELSGGMRQRVMIAMALACRPRVLIADEPTTALDVTIQAQILELLESLRNSYSMGIVLITHDLSVVAQVCHRVIVMYLGQIIEQADVVTLFDQPAHPYTQGLMASVPGLDRPRRTRLHEIAGSVPALERIPEGCRFAPRCAYADAQCRQPPPLRKVEEFQSSKAEESASSKAEESQNNKLEGFQSSEAGRLQSSPQKGGHYVRCWHYEKIGLYKIGSPQIIQAGV